MQTKISYVTYQRTDKYNPEMLYLLSKIHDHMSVLTK